MAAQQRVSPGSSFQAKTFKPPLLKPKPDDTYRENKSPESSKPTPPRAPVRKTPVQTTFSNNISVSSASERPAWIQNSRVGSIPIAPKPPDVPKPKVSSISSLQSQFSQSQEHSAPSIPRPFQSANINLLPPLVKQNSFAKEQSSGMVKDGLRTSNTINSVFPKPQVMQKTTSVGTSVTQQRPQMESSDPSAPKKKSLPPLFTLGNPPQKPNRPPNFDRQRFKGSGSSLNDNAGMKIPIYPAPSPTPQSSNTSQQEESYDDVGVMNPPPISSLEGHPTKKTEEEFSDDEMYEDLDERWKEQEEKPKKSRDTKTRKNGTKHSQIIKEQQAEDIYDDEMYEDLQAIWNDQEPKQSNNPVEMKEQERKAKKEDKQKLQEEKRLQKAKEKREKEAKRKFKIKGPVHVIQQGKALLDCKGGKVDLALRQGEIIDIVRITDNPEGLWLARNMEGYYGYVKTDHIACDHLKQQATTGNNQSGAEPEVYDDVWTPADVCSGPKGQDDEDSDTYVDVCSPEEEMSFPPPPPITDGDEVYDDVDSQSFPPPPPPSSLVKLSPKRKPEVSDPKKQKKFEKEEKEFRKKFKFEGEIQVLYDVTVASTLTTKKWGNKDLPLKPGEVISVIVEPTDGKLIGRNAEGKLGYVTMANIAQDTGDIYDDIGEDCIYDND